MMLRAKQEHLPLPGAIAIGTPMADATEDGDSLRSGIDQQRSGVAERVLRRFYTNSHDVGVGARRLIGSEWVPGVALHETGSSSIGVDL
jgi:hypothetical protein